ncbi:L-threonylcarbamoyladenylate synthase [uncultured Tateyamaria sp.]|uniref:L-threonylcarbamoyladenylate synthase n=1 Tax=uncultured Tateyamaria sp. TaxID=455651 RepID=UPI00260BB250|nr:L-threonylcarbamoyladenylate synthase [uncultured Tateyamaria sp.]
MNRIDTQTLHPNAQGIAAAVAVLGRGGLVGFPTETVYGLGGDARNGRAVAQIFAAKGRPSFNPLIVHVPDLEAARRFAQFDDTALQLAAAFWPAALTLVLPLVTGHGLSPLVTAGLETVAIRVPAHPLAQQILRAFDGPVAAPSANLSGRISPTKAAHVLADLSGIIDAVVDGGGCPVGLESTIIGGEPPALLRPGGIAVEQIEAIIGPLAKRANQITAPGQLASHYAPDASVRLNANQAHPGEVLLGFGPMQSDLNLSVSGDLIEAAAHLFDHLHRLNALGQPIAVAPIPDKGLGRAINDRLRRAAAPR